MCHWLMLTWLRFGFWCVIGWCWPDYGFVLMCHWLMLTWLWVGFDMSLVNVALIWIWHLCVVDVDLIMTWLWCGIGWCWPDYDLTLMWHWLMLTQLWLHSDVSLVDVPDYDLVLMCHWLIFTGLGLRFGFGVPSVEVLYIRHRRTGKNVM